MNRLITTLLFIALATPLVGCDEGSGSSSGLRRLVDEFGALSAADTYRTVTSLNRDELLMLGTYQAFASGVYLKACEHDRSIVGQFSTGPAGCQELATQAYNTVAFIGESGYRQNVETDRLRLLNALKCSSGEHDQGTCAAYGVATANTIKMSGDNGHAIMGGTFCDPRYDANCY